MDHDDASSAEMRRPPPNDPLALDDASVDRLLSGTLSTAGAPPGYAGVARLLAAAVAPPTPEELAGQAAFLAELRAVTRSRRDAAPARPPRPRRRRAGLAALVVVGAMATGGVAAATGHLPAPVRNILGPADAGASPGPAQSAAPGTVTTGSGGAGPGGSATTVAPGPRTGRAAAGPAARPALDGLCQAYQEGNDGEQGGKLDATAFKKLAAAAGGDDRVEAFCDELAAANAKGPKEPKDPPDDPGQGQGSPPTSIGPPTSPGGSGQNQGSPPADPSASNTPAMNDGASRAGGR